MCKIRTQYQFFEPVESESMIEFINPYIVDREKYDPPLTKERVQEFREECNAIIGRCLEDLGKEVKVEVDVRYKTPREKWSKKQITVIIPKQIILNIIDFEPGTVSSRARS